VNQVADLLEGWPASRWEPGFEWGAGTRAVCDAMHRAAVERRWVDVAEIAREAVAAPAS
jgi:hypothetical protein